MRVARANQTARADIAAGIAVAAVDMAMTAGSQLLRSNQASRALHRLHRSPRKTKAAPCRTRP